MKNITAALIFLVAIAASVSSEAQGLKDAKATFKVGNWSVLRSTNTMTDKVSCTGIYKSNFGIQLVEDQLFVKITGGIQSVTLRFGENPAQSLRLPQDMEKKIGSVVIDGSDFRQALETTRLRLQVLTLIRGMATEDLDTTGIQAAVEHIKAGCPAPSDGVVVPKPNVPAETVCSEILRSRLQSAGVTDAQISVACRP